MTSQEMTELRQIIREEVRAALALTSEVTTYQARVNQAVETYNRKLAKKLGTANG